MPSVPKRTSNLSALSTISRPLWSPVSLRALRNNSSLISMLALAITINLSAHQSTGFIRADFACTLHTSARLRYNRARKHKNETLVCRRTSHFTAADREFLGGNVE